MKSALKPVTSVSGYSDRQAQLDTTQHGQPVSIVLHLALNCVF